MNLLQRRAARARSRLIATMLAVLVLLVGAPAEAAPMAVPAPEEAAAQTVPAVPAADYQFENEVGAYPDPVPPAPPHGLILVSGTHNASNGGLGNLNDAIRRLEVPPAYRVRVCQHEVPTANTCQTVENLSGAARKTFMVGPGISRVEVRPLVVAYRSPLYLGGAQGFEIGRHEASHGDLSQVGNDAISSLRMGQGLWLRACSDNPETTTGAICDEFTTGGAFLDSALTDRISWMEIRPVTVGFDAFHLEGGRQRFGPGLFTSDQLTEVGDNAIRGVLVHEGVHTVLCDEDVRTRPTTVCRSFQQQSNIYVSYMDRLTSFITNRHTVILKPHHGSSHAGAITLRGYATDPYGPDIIGTKLRWVSSRDGLLGTGAALTRTLSSSCDGIEHVISLIATDSAGREMRTDRLVTARAIC